MSSVPPAVEDERSTSASSKPVTASLNTTVKCTGGVEVGSCWPDFSLIVTSGSVVSGTVTVDDTLAGVTAAVRAARLIALIA